MSIHLEFNGEQPTIDDMPTSKPPVFAALDVPGFVNGAPVVLAFKKAEDPADRRVIAMFENEARGMVERGQLEGWAPGA